MQCWHHGELLRYGQELESTLYRHFVFVGAIFLALWRHNVILFRFRTRHNIIEHIISRDERSYRHEY